MLLVKHTLSARKNEPSAKRTQDILAIILWPGRGLILSLGPGPGLALAITIAVIRFALASILPAGAIKSAGKSEMKRKQAGRRAGVQATGEKRNQKEVT